MSLYRSRVSAAIFYLGLTFSLASAWSSLDSEDSANGVALGLDDQCSSGSDDCSLNALQKRGSVFEGEDQAEDSYDGTRRRKPQAKDLSVVWVKKIYAWAVYLDKNVTLLEWKMYYFKEDMNETNNTLFGLVKVPHVNGKYVDWNKHPATWIPPKEEDEKDSASLEESSTDLSEESAEGTSAVVVGGRRRRSLKGVPPRKKKMLTMLNAVQKRITNMWHEVTIAKRRLNWMANWMGSHRRLYHGRPVLMQATEATIHANILEESRYRWDDTAWASGPNPQDELVEQIHSSLNQTEDLWAQMRTVGGMIMATKRRVRRYMHATPANLLEVIATEELADESDALSDEAAISVEFQEEMSVFETQEKCCQCRTGQIGWSASGKCGFCDGSVSKTANVVLQCTVDHQSFKGTKACAKTCKTMLAE